MDEKVGNAKSVNTINFLYSEGINKIPEVKEDRLILRNYGL